jgi:hypothetical protein
MVPRKPKEVTDDRWLSVTHRSPSPVIYFGGTGVWTQGFVLPNRCSTAWVKAPVHFCSSYFGNGVLSYLPGLAFNLDPPNLSLPSRYDYRYEPLAPGQLVINEVSYKAAMNAKGPDWGGGWLCDSAKTLQYPGMKTSKLTGHICNPGYSGDRD